MNKPNGALVRRGGALLAAASLLLSLSVGTVSAEGTGTSTGETARNSSQYGVTVTASDTEVMPGDTVTLTATVTCDGETVTDLAAAGLNLTTWLDYYDANGHGDGNSDAAISTPNDLSTAVTLPTEGTYYLVTEVYDTGWNKLASATTTLTVTEAPSQGQDTAVEAAVNVEKVENLPDDFIMGVDISSVMSEFASGVTYQDYQGNTIDNISDFCKFLADCGVTHVRVRIWNDPYDADGNGYGGGNNDVATAAEIAKGCADAGLKMLLDFHCSDFWCDPSKQQAPKAWSDFTLEQKEEALAQFLTSSLETISATGADIAMVQVGNETTGGFIGESGSANMCALFSAGAAAIRSFDPDIQVVIHVTNPEKSTMTSWAANLARYGVDYDVLATSYYPSWHGTLANLKKQLETVRTTYGKQVMVAETSYAYTLDDTDGHENTIRQGNNDTMMTETSYPFSAQGQASYLRDLIDTVNQAGGIGVYYWEPAWITVGDTTGLTGAEYDARVAANKQLWEQYGSGWAASYSAQYDPKDAGVWYGGSAVDNQALFDADGAPLASAEIWKLVRTGAYSNQVAVESIEQPELTIEEGDSFTMPQTVAVTYTNGTAQDPVVWDAQELAAVDADTAGSYLVHGTVTFSKTVNTGSYAGQTTAPVTFSLTVKAPNLIPAGDAGFEQTNKANFTVEGNGITLPATDDPREGKYSMHWYWASAGTSTVTYQSLSLEAGSYTFQAEAQGMEGDKVTLQVLDAEGNLLAEGTPAVLAAWCNWKTPSVQFTLTEAATVQLRIVVEMQAGGWGTLDSMYLYAMPAEETDPDEQPENPPQATPEETPGSNPEDQPGDKPASPVPTPGTAGNTTVTVTSEATAAPGQTTPTPTPTAGIRTVPQTGDTAQPALWTALLLLSGVGLLICTAGRLAMSRRR